VVDRFTGVEYFEVSTDGTCIILRPLQRSRADEVRARLIQLGIDGGGTSQQPFVDLALSGKAELLIRGDRDLLALAGRTRFLIETPEAYRVRYSAHRNQSPS
jgi:hypothetical protein